MDENVVHQTLILLENIENASERRLIVFWVREYIISSLSRDTKVFETCKSDAL